MRRFHRYLSVLAFLALVGPAAHAQVTIDVAKITCEQFRLFAVADPHDISMWLGGYYNGKRNNTIIDTQKFKEQANKVKDYCILNPKVTVMEAVEKLLGPGN
jgi:hypothetical protein